MENLLEYLKKQGAVKAQIVKGPNGAFISATKAGFVDKATTPALQFTMPVGKKSQDGRLADMNVLITPEGVAIATANMYEVSEEVTL